MAEQKKDWITDLAEFNQDLWRNVAEKLGL